MQSTDISKKKKKAERFLSRRITKKYFNKSEHIVEDFFFQSENILEVVQNEETYKLRM